MERLDLFFLNIAEEITEYGFLHSIELVGEVSRILRVQ